MKHWRKHVMSKLGAPANRAQLSSELAVTNAQLEVLGSIKTSTFLLDIWLRGLELKARKRSLEEQLTPTPD